MERAWTDRDEQAVQLFKSVNRLHHRVFDKLVDDFGVRHAHHMILMYLHRAPQPPSQRALAEAFEISPAAVAVALKKLEGDGYVTRSADPADSRSNRILLTERGEELARRTQRRFSETDRRMFESFTDGERETFVRCLGKMHDSLERLLAPAGRGE